MFLICSPNPVDVAQHGLNTWLLMQVAPPGTVHLGLSICAMVWLSSPPAGEAKAGICHLDGAKPHVWQCLVLGTGWQDHTARLAAPGARVNTGAPVI